MCKLLQGNIYEVQRLTICVNNEDNIASHHHPHPNKKLIHFKREPSLYYR